MQQSRRLCAQLFSGLSGLFVASVAGCAHPVIKPDSRAELEQAAKSPTAEPSAGRNESHAESPQGCGDSGDARSDARAAEPALAEKLTSADERLPLPAEALQSDAWVVALPTSGARDADLHWRHIGLEPTMLAPVERHPDLRPLLKDRNLVVAANAAIVLARCEKVDMSAELSRVARNVQLRLPLRCAAVESIGLLPAPAGPKAASKLTDEFGKYAGPDQVSYLPALHAESLSALARHVGPQREPRFAAAAKSPAAVVRLAAVKVFEVEDASELPHAIADLRDDGDARVRAAALRAIVAHHHPQAIDFLRRGLDDTDPSVRLAAIGALGKFGGEEARATLDRLKNHPAEITRAAVVVASSTLGADDIVATAAGDKSFRVRQAVAQTLADAGRGDRPITPATLGLANRLLRDSSAEVQRRAIEAMAQWPLEQAGPSLFLAMEKGGYLTRKTALRQLSERWPPASDFPVEAQADRRVAEMAKLKERWRQEFGPLAAGLQNTGASSTTAAAAENSASTNPLRPAARWSEVDAILEQFAARNQTERRAAAEALVKQADAARLPARVLARIGELCATENDTLVWQSVFAAVAADGSDEAASLAYLAIGNRSPEIRRRACQYLEAHGDPRHVPALLPALQDESGAVTLAAIKALGAVGKLDDPRPLVNLLANSEKQVRVEAGVALARSGATQGIAALERLAIDADPETRLRATQVMGELADAGYLPTLMALLADRTEIQRAALRSLAQVATIDAAAPVDIVSAAGIPLPPSEQVRRWQRWYESRAAGSARAAKP